MKSKKTGRSRPLKKENAIESIMKSALWSILATLGINLSLLLVGTAASLATPDPLSLVDPVGYVCLFIGSFFGGFACAKINKRSPLQVSLITGGAFVLISILASLAVPHSLASGMNIWLRLALHAASWLTFPAGTLVALKASKPTRAKRKRHR
jgi:putative membrane protein (TIGR04086 family)